MNLTWEKAGECLDGVGGERGGPRTHLTHPYGPLHMAMRAHSLPVLHVGPARSVHLGDVARPVLSSLSESKCPQSVFVS